MSTDDHNGFDRLGPKLASRTVADGDCWRFTGHIDAGGYGKYNAKYVHRIAYENAVGPIPDGLTIDHLCRNRACVNPEHLEPVTLQENIRRAYAARGPQKTHCKHGHEFTPENTLQGKKSGYRRYKACTYAAYRAWCIRSGRKKSASPEQMIANDNATREAVSA